MINFIKQRPVLSGIIAIVVLAMIALIALMNSGIYGDIIFLFFAWIMLMTIGGLCFLVAGIAMLLKNKEKIWKQLLLVGLWILLVGGGACGLLSLSILTISEVF